MHRHRCDRHDVPSPGRARFEQGQKIQARRLIFPLPTEISTILSHQVSKKIASEVRTRMMGPIETRRAVRALERSSHAHVVDPAIKIFLLHLLDQELRKARHRFLRLSPNAGKEFSFPYREA